MRERTVRFDERETLFLITHASDIPSYQHHIDAPRCADKQFSPDGVGEVCNTGSEEIIDALAVGRIVPKQWKEREDAQC